MMHTAAGARMAMGSQPHRLARNVRAAGPVNAVTASEAAAQTKLAGPEPQRFGVAQGQLLNIASAAFPALMRGGSGALCSGYSVSLSKATPADEGKYSVAALPGGYRVNETSAVGSFPRPAQPLILYDLHGCPFCKKVREAVCILDLEVLVKPCPQGGPTWRPEATARSGKRQFPFLIDPNTGAEVLESDDIIRYLFEKYGDGSVPLGLRLGFFTALTAGIGMMPRAGKGSRYRPAKVPEQPLRVWSYEASPFSVIVKEALGELELQHVQVSVARGSQRRQEMLDARGHFQAPLLEDPNTGVAMFESAAIIEYLNKTYAQ